jgi:hypothetical protein
MAISVFGVTHTKVHDHHFPQVAAFSTASKPTATIVGEMVDEEAAKCAGALRAEGIEPATISAAQATYPEAYAWCAETIKLGAALRAIGAMSGQNPEIAKTWKLALDERYEDLDARGWVALGDAPAPSQDANGPRTFIDSLSLDTGDTDDDSDLEPTFRRSDSL